MQTTQIIDFSTEIVYDYIVRKLYITMGQEG